MQFQTVAIVGKYHAQGIDQPLSDIAAFVQERGGQVVFEADTARAMGAAAGYDVATLGNLADVAIVVGGDGTMLGLARELAPYNVPLIGINHGRLGFMTDIPLQTWRDALGPMLDGTYDTEERTMLEASVHRGDQELVRANALNDVVVSRSGVGGMIELSAQVDGLYMYNQRADGLIIATPTGSTAYALSAQGPILHPTLAGLVLVPVAPQALSNRPIVLPDHCHIEITLTRSPGGRDNTSSVHFDMQTWSHLQEGDRIQVRRAKHTIRFLHPAGSNYFATLRRKLHWNLMPSEREEG
jgi:NAD+ kinase